MRNLGGAIGIAVVNTWLQDNARIEAARFGETLGRYPQAATDAIAALAHRLAAATPDPAQGLLLAQKVIGRTVGQQALTLAFGDVFRLMTWMFLVALVMVPFARSSGSKSPVAVETH